MSDPFRLTGQRVLIFGAASGIGAAAMALCAELGANVVGADIADMTAAVAALAGRGLKVEGHACDITARDAVEALVAGIGPVDAMILTSAICPWTDWMDEDWDAVLDRTMRVNVGGTVHCVRAVLPGMIARGSGRIVLVGSIAGRMGGLASGPHYVASKGGIHALVKWFARRGAPHNVLVNGIAPGAVLTPMIDGQPLDLRNAGIGRAADPREIAAPLAFLCSPAASYISGAILDVNGGVYLAP